MAGTDPTGSFNAATVRTELEAAMVMGLPNNPIDRPTFRWLTPNDITPGSPSGNPYDWSTGTAPTEITDLQVNCAVQYGGDTEDGTVAGVEEAVRAVLTILDTDMATLLAHGGRMPDQVLLAQSIYNMDYFNQEALFDMDVYILYCTSLDAA